MFGFGKKKNNKADDGVIVLKKTAPDVCGGTDATLDTKAPKEIKSDDMLIFDVSSMVDHGIPGGRERGQNHEPVGTILAYASKGKKGSFVYLANRAQHRTREDNSEAAYIKDDIFPSLVDLVKEENLAKDNGFHSTTHGLPMNFGGSIDIEYASGENISISNNQSPVMKRETGYRIYDLFKKALERGKVGLPSVDDLAGLRYDEIRGGSFVKVYLTFNGDGSANSKKSSCYDGEKVYEKESVLSRETVSLIKKNIEKNKMFAWADLPERRFKYEQGKTMTFVFSDGSEITADRNRCVPMEISNGFFNIELEIVTKN